MISTDDAIRLTNLWSKELCSGKLPQDKRTILGTLVGFIVGIHTQLPTTETTDPTNYYVSRHEAESRNMFDQINRFEFIDTMLANEVARNVYLARYKIVYNPVECMRVCFEMMTGQLSTLPPKAKQIIASIDKEAFDAMAYING